MDLGRPVAKHHVRRPHEQVPVGGEPDPATEVEQARASAPAAEQPVPAPQG